MTILDLKRFEFVWTLQIEFGTMDF